LCAEWVIEALKGKEAWKILLRNEYLKEPLWAKSVSKVLSFNL
jgi:hypothetical protein